MFGNAAPAPRRRAMARYDLKRPHRAGVLSSSPLAALKVLEVKLLGKRASSYCYNFPAVYQIEITNRCNLSCKMCSRLEELRAEGSVPADMSMETLRRILDQIRSVYHIGLFGRGEPLLHPDLIGMIEYCAHRGVPQISITTNGLLLSGETRQSLAASKLTELRVSIDGADPKTYREIRNADLEKVLDNVRQFTASSDIPVTVNFVLGESNWDGALGMPELTRSIGAQCLRVFNTLGRSGSVLAMVQRDGHRAGSYDRLRKDLSRRCAEMGLAFQIDRLGMRRCLWPFFMAFIDIDGHLTPCCRLEHIRLSSVAKDGLFKAWNHTNVRAWRKRILRGDFPRPCRDIHCTAG
ncbi:MAG: radical SAM protein [bacterium]